MLDEFPDNQVFLIPARLDDCEPPVAELAELDFADLFPQWEPGVERIRKSLGLDVGSPKKPAEASVPAETPVPATARKATAGPDEAVVPERSPTSTPRTPAARSRYKVALIDLDGRIRDLPRIARGLTRAQDFFTFSATTRATPRGARRTKGGQAQFYINGVPETFYHAIAPLQVDFAVCLTSAHVAFEEDGKDHWSYLSCSSPEDERVMFVSHAGLRGYASEAGVTFAMAIANQVTSQLVAYFLDLQYHDATRGCPMDFCEELSDVVEALSSGTFCAPCRKKLRRNAALQQAVEGLIEWGR